METTLPNSVTIPQLARITGKNPSFLARCAKEIGYEKAGRDYLLTRSQAKKLLASIRETCGKPSDGKILRNGKRAAQTT